MALINKWFGKKKAAVASPPAPQPEPDAEPAEDATDTGTENGSTIIGPDGVARPRKGLLRRFESNLRRKVDGYVDNKAGELLDDATKRAQQFRQETLDAVRGNAMDLLDLTEQRIDEKLVEIEQMLEKRLQAELKMRLRAMFWTLVFVLVMALVSLGYVWFKQQSGLNTSNQAANQQPIE